MAFNTLKVLRSYGMVPIFAALSGIAATLISSHELSPVSQMAAAQDWPQTELHTAASAALAFRRDEGRLPGSLDELRSAKGYLPKDFALKGTMYFRDDDGTPSRLSWHDDEDGVSAYCRLDAAVARHCG